MRDRDASWELNEPDAYALEEALRLKEKHGGEVIVVSAGPARVSQVIREALARGADRAIHVESDAIATADAWATADALAAAIKDEQVDLVLTGLQSDDQGFAQVGVVLAERLGMPHSTIIMEVQASPSMAQAGELRVKRELEGGWFQWIAMPLPAVLTIQSGINQLRYATLKGIMAAKKKEVKVVPMPAVAAARAEDRLDPRAAEIQADADAGRLAGRGRQGARARAARGSEGHLVDAMKRARHRRAAGRRAQSRVVGSHCGRAAASGRPVTSSSAGRERMRRSAAGELAAADVAEVVALEHAALETYTPDGFVAGRSRRSSAR